MERKALLKTLFCVVFKILQWDAYSLESSLDVVGMMVGIVDSSEVTKSVPVEAVGIAPVVESLHMVGRQGSHSWRDVEQLSESKERWRRTF